MAVSEESGSGGYPVTEYPRDAEGQATCLRRLRADNRSWL